MLTSVTHEPESLVVRTDVGDQIHYLDWGTPDGSALPPIVLLHGLAATSWEWAPVARRLSELTRVFALDLRGHGLSDSPRSGYDLESLAFDSLTVLVAHGYGVDANGTPAVVAGHGFGAQVAATMAALQPGSISGLGLIDFGWEDMESATGQSPAEFEAAVADPPEVLTSMKAYLADRREFDPESWDADQERAAKATVDEKYAGHVSMVTRTHVLRGSIEAMYGFRPIETLARLPQPMLIAVAESGAADDAEVRDRRLALDDVIAARDAAGVSAPDVRRFVGAGHNLMRYRPAELTDAMIDLLKAAEAYQRS
jgi:pimeloyl-ACP methyl ester carboxylesterase